MGSCELVPWFGLLVRSAFALPVKLSLSQPMSFLTFILLVLSPIPPGGSEQLRGAWLLTGAKPQQQAKTVLQGGS